MIRPCSHAPRGLSRLASVAAPGAVLLVAAAPALAADGAGVPDWPWWVWPIGLFTLTLLLGILAVLAGIGGSVLFVPIVSGFAPFLHIDFIRGAGIMVALTGALSAGPGLIRQGMSDLKLAIPLALVASFSSIFGALAGLQMPAWVVQITLGAVILATAALIWFVRPSEHAPPGAGDRLSRAMGIEGAFWDPTLGRERVWRPRALVPGMAMFAAIGFMAGMFGLGAGWANVPVLNIVMGLPLKFSVATSYFLLAIAGPSAALVYVTEGAMVPLIVVPSVLGSMVGARVGAWVLVRIHPPLIRVIVVLVLVLAGIRAVLRGFGI